VVGVSRAAQVADIRAEWCVVSRGQWASTFHRADPDANEPAPACSQREADDRGEFREVRIGVIGSHYSPCSNPSCYGAQDPRGGHICPGGLADRPIRIQTYQVAVAAAVFGRTPLARSDVEVLLGLTDAESRSVKRGLADARAAGWLVYDESARAYRPGPMADHVGGDQA
jgi:hypothetical protein